MGKRNWRNSPEYRKWHKRVLERDNYTCQICGAKENLVAHHINHASYFPEQRFDVNNGVTLCYECHMNFHNNFKRSYRQKCTRYDWDNFVVLANYFKRKFVRAKKEEEKEN